jgi:hypothetical protein
VGVALEVSQALGRDGMAVFMPRLDTLDETWHTLIECGFRPLSE